MSRCRAAVQRQTGIIITNRSPFTVVPLQVQDNCTIVTEAGPILDASTLAPIGYFRANANQLDDNVLAQVFVHFGSGSRWIGQFQGLLIPGQTLEGVVSSLVTKEPAMIRIEVIDATTRRITVSSF